jgi:hypothetical protein
VIPIRIGVVEVESLAAGRCEATRGSHRRTSELESGEIGVVRLSAESSSERWS